MFVLNKNVVYKLQLYYIGIYIGAILSPYHAITHDSKRTYLRNTDSMILS